MSTAVVCRSQAVFNASVVADGLPTFEGKWLEDMVVSSDGPGKLFLTTYLGRGPFDHSLGASAELFFDHGEKPYPAFEIPSVGPSNAALRAYKSDQHLKIPETGALFVVNVTTVKTVTLESWEVASENRIDAALAAGISATLSETKAVLDAIIGSYALYQFPLVWQHAFERHSHAFFDSAKQLTTRAFHLLRTDNFVSFRLDASSQVAPDHAFVDPLHKQAAAVVGAQLVEPLIFLKDSLWHRDIRARFLLQFWIVEYFSEQRAVNLPPDQDMRSLVAALEALTKQHLPEHLARFKNKKGELLRRTLAEKVEACCEALRVQYEDADFKRAKNVRDNLSHGSAYSQQDLNESELYIRSLCRHVLRRELEWRGIFLEGAPQPFEQLKILTIPSFRGDRPDMQKAKVDL